MSEPSVCCITPTHMPQYWERVKACFESQTYQRKHWLPMDTRGMGLTVGALRNMMIRSTGQDFDLIAHFDHDDWSAPTRLAEQVEFMQATGSQVVGYYDMPLYDELRDKVLLYDSHNPNYALGTSLMYRREAWERVRFPDQTPEDTTWQNQVGPENVASVSCLTMDGPIEPRMVQTVHKASAAARVCLHSSRVEPAGVELDGAVREILNATRLDKAGR